MRRTLAAAGVAAMAASLLIAGSGAAHAYDGCKAKQGTNPQYAYSECPGYPDQGHFVVIVCEKQEPRFPTYTVKGPMAYGAARSWAKCQTTSHVMRAFGVDTGSE